MNSVILLGQLLVLSCVINTSLQQMMRRKLSAAQQEGRVPELDDLIERHISSINRDDPVNMKSVINEVKFVGKTSHDKEMVEYYVRLLTDIQENGINFINDERDRLHTILESTKGAERDHAHYQNNVVEGIVDMAAEDVLSQMMAFDPNLQHWDSADLSGNKRHDEV